MSAAHLRSPGSAGDGFTLVEILVAMGLFLVGVTALLGLFHFGGSMEATARAHGSLAPAVEPLIEEIRNSVWRFDSGGTITGLREFKGLPVPGATDYRYDLEVEPPGDDPAVRVAWLRFYRNSPERPVERVRFLLDRRVPLERRLQGDS